MPIDPDTIAFAHKLADTRGEVIRPYFRQRIEISDKGLAQGGVFDPVTAADKGAEEAIRTIIERERPDDGILGEEFGQKVSRNGRTWVLDPVDGTRAFITGRHFGALALGFVDVIIESSFHRWDVAALIPIVEGAGGIITNWQGSLCPDGGQILAAGDVRVHAQAMKLLAG